jgi:hypothetical protein
VPVVYKPYTHIKNNSHVAITIIPYLVMRSLRFREIKLFSHYRKLLILSSRFYRRLFDYKILLCSLDYNTVLDNWKISSQSQIVVTVVVIRVNEVEKEEKEA